MRKIIGNKKAISTILAALLMVVIVVVASVMVYAWSTGLLGGLFIKPTTGTEALNMENYAFNANPDIVTLNIRNTGSSDVNLITYYVRNTAGSQYAKTTWATATAQPNTLLQDVSGPADGIDITIGTTCGTSCTLTGTTGFSFANAGQYTITVVTAKNFQFSFTVVK